MIHDADGRFAICELPGGAAGPMLVKMARTAAVQLKGILAYYDYPISTGPLEGTNNKIKTTCLAPDLTSVFPQAYPYHAVRLPREDKS